MDTFADLPDALVRDLLKHATRVAECVTGKLRDIRESRSLMRSQAMSARLVCRKADLDVVREPSVVGVDGSYQVNRLTAIDLCASAAVAVEGTAKEARRHWPEPYHEMWVDALPHAAESAACIRALMVQMELSIAMNAPHDLVLLDGSFSSLIIYLNQGLSRFGSAPVSLRREVLDRWNSATKEHLMRAFRSTRLVAMPKFTSRNELARPDCLTVPTDVDGKTLATLILEPGEYISPLPLQDPRDPASQAVDHLPRELCDESSMEEILAGFNDLYVTYFRPYGWLPALRIEMPGVIARSRIGLATVLDGVSKQLFSPAVFEPYPLFLADRMVKSLGAGVSVIEEAVAQHAAASFPDIETTLICLHNYRTEGGRGGVS